MDVSDLWEWSLRLRNALASTKGAMTIDGKQWGVPYTYYQWGVYYRKDIFDELGLSEPTTWDEELANCQTLLDKSGVKCYTIGTKFLWTAGGWFDYINSRTNGYDFHMAAGPRRGRMDRRPRARNLRQLARADRHGRLHRRPPELQLARGAALHRQNGRRRRVPDGQLRRRGLARRRADDDQLDFYQFPVDQPGCRTMPRTRRPTRSTSRRPMHSNMDAAREFLRFVDLARRSRPSSTAATRLASFR